MSDSIVATLATFTASEAAAVSGVPIAQQGVWRAREYLPSNDGRWARFDVFDLSRLIFQKRFSDKRIPLKTLAEAAPITSVAIAHRVLMCPEAWSGVSPFDFAKAGDPRGWADLVTATTFHHAHRRGLPAETTGHFLLFWADDSFALADDFSPELWAEQDDDKTADVRVLDLFRIAQALVDRIGRPVATISARVLDGSAGRSGSEASLGQSPAESRQEGKAGRPAKETVSI